jgi:hypothetical protein
LILCPDNEYSSKITKEIHDYEKLFNAFKRCAELANTGVLQMFCDTCNLTGYSLNIIVTLGKTVLAQ